MRKYKQFLLVLVAHLVLLAPLCVSMPSFAQTEPAPPGVDTGSDPGGGNLSQDARNTDETVPDSAYPVPATNTVTQAAEQNTTDTIVEVEDMLDGDNFVTYNDVYQGLHTFWGEDIISNLFHNIGQLIGKWITEFINGWVSDTVQFLTGFLRMFVLNPNIAINGINGQPNDDISPWVRQGADIMYGIAVDLLLLLFILCIWKYWAEATWRGGGNLMGAVGRLIFTAGLMLAWPTIYAFEIQITNEMIRAIYFNSADQVAALDAAMAAAVKGGLLAGAGLIANATAPAASQAFGGILGGGPGGMILGTVGSVVAFAGLLIYMILGGILIAELVYILVLKGIQTALLTAQYMFAPVFLVFFATPDTESVTAGFVRSFVEVSLWTFAWVGLLKIMVIIIMSDFNPWGKIVLAVGVLQLMIQVPQFLARAQISPMSSFITAAGLTGGLLSMGQAVGRTLQDRSKQLADKIGGSFNEGAASGPKTSTTAKLNTLNDGKVNKDMLKKQKDAESGKLKTNKDKDKGKTGPDGTKKGQDLKTADGKDKKNQPPKKDDKKTTDPNAAGTQGGKTPNPADSKLGKGVDPSNAGDAASGAVKTGLKTATIAAAAGGAAAGLGAREGLKDTGTTNKDDDDALDAQQLAAAMKQEQNLTNAGVPKDEDDKDKEDKGKQAVEPGEKKLNTGRGEGEKDKKKGSGDDEKKQAEALAAGVLGAEAMKKSKKEKGSGQDGETRTPVDTNIEKGKGLKGLEGGPTDAKGADLASLADDANDEDGPKVDANGDPISMDIDQGEGDDGIPKTTLGVVPGKKTITGGGDRSGKGPQPTDLKGRGEGKDGLTPADGKAPELKPGETNVGKGTPVDEATSQLGQACGEVTTGKAVDPATGIGTEDEEHPDADIAVAALNDKHHGSGATINFDPRAFVPTSKKGADGKEKIDVGTGSPTDAAGGGTQEGQLDFSPDGKGPEMSPGLQTKIDADTASQAGAPEVSGIENGVPVNAEGQPVKMEQSALNALASAAGGKVVNGRIISAAQAANMGGSVDQEFTATPPDMGDATPQAGQELNVGSLNNDVLRQNGLDEGTRIENGVPVGADGQKLELDKSAMANLAASMGARVVAGKLIGSAIGGSSGPSVEQDITAHTDMPADMQPPGQELNVSNINNDVLRQNGLDSGTRIENGVPVGADGQKLGLDQASLATLATAMGARVVAGKIVGGGGSSTGGSVDQEINAEAPDMQPPGQELNVSNINSQVLGQTGLDAGTSIQNGVPVGADGREVHMDERSLDMLASSIGGRVVAGKIVSGGGSSGHMGSVDQEISADAPDMHPPSGSELNVNNISSQVLSQTGLDAGTRIENGVPVGADGREVHMDSASLANLATAMGGRVVAGKIISGSGSTAGSVDQEITANTDMDAQPPATGELNVSTINSQVLQSQGLAAGTRIENGVPVGADGQQLQMDQSALSNLAASMGARVVAGKIVGMTGSSTPTGTAEADVNAQIDPTQQGTDPAGDATVTILPDGTVGVRPQGQTTARVHSQQVSGQVLTPGTVDVNAPPSSGGGSSGGPPGGIVPGDIPSGGDGGDGGKWDPSRFEGPEGRPPDGQADESQFTSQYAEMVKQDPLNTYLQPFYRWIPPRTVAGNIRLAQNTTLGKSASGQAELVGNMKGATFHVRTGEGQTNEETAMQMMGAGYAGLVGQDPAAYDAARQSSIDAGADQPQNWKQRMAAGIMSYNGRSWSQTAAAKQNFQLSMYDSAVQGSMAYVNNESGNAYTEYLRQRYGPMNEEQQAAGVHMMTSAASPESAWNWKHIPATETLVQNAIGISPYTRAAAAHMNVLKAQPWSRAARIQGIQTYMQSRVADEGVDAEAAPVRDAWIGAETQQLPSSVVDTLGAVVQKYGPDAASDYKLINNVANHVGAGKAPEAYVDRYNSMSTGVGVGSSYHRSGGGGGGGTRTVSAGGGQGPTPTTVVQEGGGGGDPGASYSDQSVVFDVVDDAAATPVTENDLHPGQFGHHARGTGQRVVRATVNFDHAQGGNNTSVPPMQRMRVEAPYTDSTPRVDAQMGRMSGGSGESVVDYQVQAEILNSNRGTDYGTLDPDQLERDVHSFVNGFNSPREMAYRVNYDLAAAGFSDKDLANPQVYTTSLQVYAQDPSMAKAAAVAVNNLGADDYTVESVHTVQAIMDADPSMNADNISNEHINAGTAIMRVTSQIKSEFDDDHPIQQMKGHPTRNFIQRVAVQPEFQGNTAHGPGHQYPQSIIDVIKERLEERLRGEDPEYGGKKPYPSSRSA